MCHFCDVQFAIIMCDSQIFRIPRGTRTRIIRTLRGSVCVRSVGRCAEVYEAVRWSERQSGGKLHTFHNHNCVDTFHNYTRSRGREHWRLVHHLSTSYFSSYVFLSLFLSLSLSFSLSLSLSLSPFVCRSLSFSLSLFLSLSLSLSLSLPPSLSLSDFSLSLSLSFSLVPQPQLLLTPTRKPCRSAGAFGTISR